MNQTKFKRLTKQLNIKPTTASYKGAWDVLIDGMTVRDAAMKHNTSTQLVSSVVKKLRETKVELTEVERAVLMGEERKAHDILATLMETEK